jgi:hypothetical protein
MKHRRPRRSNNQGKAGSPPGASSPWWDATLRLHLHAAVLICVTWTTGSVADALLASSALEAAAQGLLRRGGTQPPVLTH